MANIGWPVKYAFGKYVILRKTVPLKLSFKALEVQYPSRLKYAILGLSQRSSTLVAFFVLVHFF